MTFIVHGASGAQGAPVLHLLRSEGLTAVAARQHTPRGDDQGEVVADLGSAESLIDAYTSTQGVFVHLPLASEEDRATYAENIVRALRATLPGMVVISTSGEALDEVPDDAALARLIRGVRALALRSAVVAPRIYLENLLLPGVLTAVKEHGRLPYPLPAQTPVSWSSHADVARVVVHLLTGRFTSPEVHVGHLPGLRGDDLARGFSEWVGRHVHYEAITPEEFQRLLTPDFGEVTASGIAEGYRDMARVPEVLISERRSAQHQFGIEPATVAAWLSTHAS